jgi:hypothetical protein
MFAMITNCWNYIKICVPLNSFFIRSLNPRKNSEDIFTYYSSNDETIVELCLKSVFFGPMSFYSFFKKHNNHEQIFNAHCISLHLSSFQWNLNSIQVPYNLYNKKCYLFLSLIPTSILSLTN